MFCSCDKTERDVEIPEGYFRGSEIGWHLNGTIKLEDIKKTCADIPSDLLKYKVECYKLEYVTAYKNELVRAEALIAMPWEAVGQSTDEMKMAVYCHGTNVPMGEENMAKRFSEYSGPGKGRDYEEIVKCILPLASNGYLTVAPEYTGYGSTCDRTHCFVYGPELTKSIIDAIFAARTFFEAMGFPLSLIEGGVPLYLTGWSQGGAGALATEYYLEKDYPDEDYNIIATSCLSGPYNLKGFIERAFANPYDFNLTTALYSWAAYCINYFDEGTQRPTDQMFVLPIYDQTSSLMFATSCPANVFRENFMQRVLDGTDIGFCEAMARSSYHQGWCPKAKVYLYHGTDDMIVPFFNSKDTYENLKKEGADIEFYPYEGKGHTDFVHEYMTRTIQDFSALDK